MSSDKEQAVEEVIVELPYGGETLEIDGFLYQISGNKRYKTFVWPECNGYSVAYSMQKFEAEAWSVNVMDEDVSTFCVWYKRCKTQRMAQFVRSRVQRAIRKHRYTHDEQGFLVFPWWRFLKSD